MRVTRVPKRSVGDLLRHYLGALQKDQHRVAAVGQTHKGRAGSRRVTLHGYRESKDDRGWS